MLLTVIAAVWPEILREALYGLVVLILIAIGHLLEFVHQVLGRRFLQASTSVGLLDLRMRLVLEAIAVETALGRGDYIDILRIVAENNVVLADDSWTMVIL